MRFSFQNKKAAATPEKKSVVAAASEPLFSRSALQITQYFAGMVSPAQFTRAAYSSSFFFAAGLMFLRADVSGNRDPDLDEFIAFLR